MKRFAIGIVLLFLAVAVSSFSQVAFMKDTAKICEITQEILDFAKESDFEKAEKRLDELSAYFKKAEKWLSIILHHDDIENLNVNISSLKSYIDIKDFDNFKNCCIQILNEVENLRNSMKLKIENIL